MANGISQNKSIILLDLSNNNFNDDSGFLIGKILGSHCENRNNWIWMAGLRNEKPPEDIALKGINEINLSGNNLGDKFIQKLSSFIQFDTWTRV